MISLCMRRKILHNSVLCTSRFRLFPLSALFVFRIKFSHFCHALKTLRPPSPPMDGSRKILIGGETLNVRQAIAFPSAHFSWKLAKWTYIHAFQKMIHINIDWVMKIRSDPAASHVTWAALALSAHTVVEYKWKCVYFYFGMIPYPNVIITFRNLI